MLITYKRDITPEADNSVFEGYIDSINGQLTQRLANSNKLTNVRDFNLFGSNPDITYLNQTDKLDNITRLKFYFRSKSDVATVYPLQGIEGFPEEGGSFQLGEKISGQDDIVLNFADFKSINTIYTIFVTPSAGYESDYKRYQKRIIGLFIEGQAPDSSAKTLLLSSPKYASLTTGLTLDQLDTAMAAFNRPNNKYKMDKFLASTPYLINSPNIADQRAAIINVGSSIFHGDSSNYIRSLKFINALPLKDYGFNKTKTQQLDFLLDFEEIKAVEGCTYEMDFQATDTSSSLDISQKGSSFTLSIPSVSVGVYQGASVGIGSPASYTLSSSQSKQATESTQTQVVEKLVLKLPAVFYQAVNFTNISIPKVTATARVSYADTDFTLTIPLNKKILLCKDSAEVTTSIINSI